MTDKTTSFGVLDSRFLSRSVGLLNPPDPLTLNEKSTLKEALAVLKDNKIGAVIVTDREGKVSGVFSERDVILKVALEGPKLDVPLSELMTADPQTVEMTETIAFALQLMSEYGYRHLPIVDDEKYPVGVISVKDLLDFIARTVISDLQSFRDG